MENHTKKFLIINRYTFKKCDVALAACMFNVFNVQFCYKFSISIGGKTEVCDQDQVFDLDPQKYGHTRKFTFFCANSHFLIAPSAYQQSGLSSHCDVSLFVCLPICGKIIFERN